MAEAQWDTIIVGGGLAGTTLAWALQDAGQRVLVIDAEDATSSSRIAAGLITPITGRRLTVSERFDPLFAVAIEFYRRVERVTGRPFFTDRTAIRLLASDTERQKWRERRRQPEFLRHLCDPQPAPLIDPTLAKTGGGGFAMRSAQLDVAGFLDAAQGRLPVTTMRLDWRRDVVFAADAVTVGRHRARRLISCEGYAASRNPWFSWLPFRAAKGDILTIRFHRRFPAVVMHKGVWISPTSDSDAFRVGATYEWDDLEGEPSPAARAEIEDKLRELTAQPYTVVDHRAAVRPIIERNDTVVGLHPEEERLGVFNGLGSKGSLLAPWYAGLFADFLANGTPLPEDADVRHKGYR